MSATKAKFFQVSYTFQEGSGGLHPAEANLIPPPCCNLTARRFPSIRRLVGILKLSSVVFLDLSLMLGQLGAILGRLGVILGRPGPILGRTWAVGVKSQKTLSMTRSIDEYSKLRCADW